MYFIFSFYRTTYRIKKRINIFTSWGNIETSHHSFIKKKKIDSGKHKLI